MRLITILLIFMAALNLFGQNSSIIAEKAEIKKIATGYAFTEGPAVSPNGQVFFTDQPNDRIYVWDETGGVALWSDDTGRSNGIYFNADGQLVSCAEIGRASCRERV